MAGSLDPPEVRLEFWDSEELREAFRERHMGHVIRAYRNQPFYGRRKIPQELMASWLHTSQSTLARREYDDGRHPITDITTLIAWARTLKMPQDKLWFKLPETEDEGTTPAASPADIAPRKSIPPEAARSPLMMHDAQEVYWGRPDQLIRDPGEWQACAEEAEEEMERRALLQSLAILGVGIAPMNQALETVRTAVGSAMGDNERYHLDDWEETVAEYGYSYLTTPLSQLIPDLAADLVTVRSIVRRIPGDTPEFRSWCRVSGVLSGLMAKSLSNLSDVRESRQWWNTAQHLADSSGDMDACLWVRGERLIHGLYENRPMQVLLRQAQSASEFAHDHACAGYGSLTNGRAQLAALSGDYQTSEDNLRRSGEILSQLPTRVTQDTSSVMGWGEDRLRYTEAWVYAYMGNEEKTDRAAERALQLYPDSDKRTPAQIRLMQSFARIQSGDTTEGIRYAHAVYEPLLPGQRTTMVDTLARRVLDAVPGDAQRRPDVMEYRALIGAPAGKVIES